MRPRPARGIVVCDGDAMHGGAHVRGPVRSEAAAPGTCVSSRSVQREIPIPRRSDGPLLRILTAVLATVPPAPVAPPMGR